MFVLPSGTCQRAWVIAEAIRKGIGYEEIHALTMIDVWFLDKIAILVEMEQKLKTAELTPELLREAKRLDAMSKSVLTVSGLLLMIMVS